MPPVDDRPETAASFAASQVAEAAGLHAEHRELVLAPELERLRIEPERTLGAR